MTVKSQYSIALLIETSSTYGRHILRGIQRFIQEENKRDWIAVIEERDVNAGMPGWIKNWSGDGIICRHVAREFKKQLLEQEIAFVDLTDRNELSPFTIVRSDDREIGRTAAEHLVDRGLSNFAFCGFNGEAWSNRREAGFRNSVEALADATYFSIQSDWYAQDVKRWDEEKANLTKWLLGLPKPIGIMACNDLRGKQLIDCCHASSIDVPESVAIVGVDNDEFLCSFCRTPLTSVMPNAEEIGFQSARILSKMLTNKKARAKVEEITIPPLGVFARRSSDIVAVEDQELADILRYIRHHAGNGISVGDVVREIGLSRSTIERKMREVVGRSPQQEIRRVQLKQVCSLLTGSALPIESIALQCGFENPEYMHVVFKRKMKMTPGEYRNLARNH